MNAKTTKLKATSANGAPGVKVRKSANGKLAMPPSEKKSMYEHWIEKYGIDDSESASGTLEIWKMVYETHNKPKS